MTRNPKDRQVSEGQYTRTAGLFVSLLSVLFVLGLILYLFASAYLQHEQLAPVLPAKTAEEFGMAIHPTQLEMQLQNLKSVRFGYALLYRFSLWAAVAIIALAMIVLGSVLIFDRVQDNQGITFEAFIRDADAFGLGQNEKRQVPDPDKNEDAAFEKNARKMGAGYFWAALSTTFPGLMMVFMGTLTLLATLLMSGPLARKITLIDAPVYTYDMYRCAKTRPMLVVGGKPDERAPDCETPPSLPDHTPGDADIYDQQ